ncbi:hypothetical protein IV203_008594 [Nitzschia inconspicua]|uniref:Uncharacterized protein n=1 Tax=Nitzschia inconspicua TaxID=303405 RepID=A0A9K3L0L8_9STRA|nr:hypothetical protein IV203_008594 [Nitzschia inconspicua]
MSVGISPSIPTNALFADRTDAQSFMDHGLKAKASELNDLEDEDVLDVSDEGFEDLADEVSRMGIGSDDDDDAETMGFKSVRFTGDTKSFVGGGIARKKREYHLQPVLPYVLDKWTDEHLRSRVSIQIHGISGHEFKQCTEQRVSTDQQYFCHSWPLSKWHLTPERAFNVFDLLSIEDMSIECSFRSQMPF